MKPDTPLRIAGFFTIGYLGFLAHIGLEAMILTFKKDSFPPEQLAEISEMMTGPVVPWMAGTLAALTALPIALALTVESARGWLVALILSGLLTAAHLLHYAGEMTEGVDGVGVMSLLVHVLPSAWGCVLIAKWRKTLPG